MKAHPDWLKKTIPSTGNLEKMEHMLGRLNLATVCQAAQCPNIGECFNEGTATFMILGDQCTRNCRFCAVKYTKTPLPADEKEPYQVAEAVKKLELTHVVITSVTRDDLPDGGADQFVKTIKAVRNILPLPTIEILVPDFGGDKKVLQTVFQAQPDVFNHNVETVPRLYAEVRPQAAYKRSLKVLAYAAQAGLVVKSGLMLGLGETKTELESVFRDLLDAGCRILTLGQYLAPSMQHAPVRSYVPPAEFDELATGAREMGFEQVFAGTFVRSSYKAGEIMKQRCF